MASTNFKVSHSKVKLWRRCRHAYHLKYVERLEKKRVARPLQFGRLVHSMLEYDACGKDAGDVIKEIPLKEQKLFKAEREMYGDILSDVQCIMSEYFDYYPENSLVPIKVQGRYAEHEFEVVATPGISLVGKIDMIARTPNKLRWLVEHKSFKNMPTEDDRWRNTQSTLYYRVVDMLGWKMPDGICWDYIHSKPPAWPPLLKNGQMTRKAVVTLPSRVREALKKYKLPEEDYADVVEAAKARRSHYFQRTFNPVKPSVVQHVWEDFVRTSNEMADCHGKRHERNIDRHCSWCDFEPICRAELSGHDTAFIKRNDYRERAKNEQAEPTDAGD